MVLAYLQIKLVPAGLLLVLFSIIYFFLSNIGDPTKSNITNDNNVEIESSYLITPLNESFFEILAVNNAFSHVNLKEIPWSFEQHAYWLKFVITNKKNEVTNLVSHFDNAMIDDLSIFQVSGKDTIIKQQHLGDHQMRLAFAQRTTPHFNFDISPMDETTLYIRIATTGIANTPIHFYHNRDFVVLVQKVHLLWGVFIGVSIIIALYNLVLFFAVKDAVYLIYNAYILSGISLMGVVLGYGFYIFPESVQLAFNLQVIALNCSVTIFAILFLVYFLKFQLNKQWHYWLAMIAIFSLSSLLIVSLWLPEYQTAPLFFMLMPGVYIVCFILLITKIQEGLEWGRLYIYSWIPLLIGAAVQPLLLMGKIEYNFITQHAFMIAILVEIVLMAMALADRMRYQKEQVIYHATHEVSSGLPNKISLETHVSKLINDKVVFATCLIEIENYQTLAPYISTQSLQKLELQIVKNITPMLNIDPKVSLISNNNNRPLKLGKVSDGRLMFIFETLTSQPLTIFVKALQNVIIRELQLNGLLIELKTNIGVCYSAKSDPNLTANEYIQHSLLAIEQNRGCDGYLHYYHDLEVLNIKAHLALACDLQYAIKNNYLNLYHQPQINLKTGSVYGSEVLLRWNHPEHGFISPEVFVRIAEDTGLINELTRWVIDCAFKQLQELHAHQYFSHKVSINISGKDIGLPNFLSYVEEKMIAFNIPRDVIVLELTESVMVSDFIVLNNLMVALNKLGIQLSIDDYGTGYSSLNYLSQLNFDELKIDKAFILNLDESTRNLAIVKTTIEMAHNLDLKVIAEGVESQSIEQHLIDSGCDIGQGYYYAQPLPFDKYLLWLASYNNKKERQSPH